MNDKPVTWDEARRSIDLPGFVESYGISLQKAGQLYKGVCPFHPEKTPSLTIYPDNHYYCFGCQEGGNALTFAMKMDGTNRKNALTKLSAYIGKPISGYSPDGIDFVHRRTLLAINEVAARYFEESLGKHQKRQLYLQRGLTDESIKKFKLGYAPPSGMAERFAKEPISPESLVDSGLMTKGNSPFFRNRLMIPYVDPRGNIVGFSGRAITEKDEKEAKYINTPATGIFQKRLQLYLFGQARDAIRETGKALLEEGQIDAIMSHQCGIRNAIAIGGTAITREHAYALRHISELVLVLDGDNAGVKAALRGAGNLTTVGSNVKVVVLPIYEKTGKGHDPDSYLRDPKCGPDKFMRLIEKAKPFFEAYYDYLSSVDDINTANGRLHAGRELAYAVSLSSNPFEQAYYIDFISRKLKVDANVFTEAVISTRKETENREREKELSPAQVEKIVSSMPMQSPSIVTEEALAINLLHNGNFPGYVATQLRPDMFSDPGFRQLAELRLNMPNYNPSTDLGSVKEQVSRGENAGTGVLRALEYGDDRMPSSSELGNMVNELRRQRREEKLRSISNDIVQSPSGRAGLLDDLLETLQQE